jgi:hypothetical protein
MAIEYVFHLRGRIREALLADLEGMSVDFEAGETLLHGPVADQAAFCAIIGRLQCLGVDLVEVRPLVKESTR